MRCEQRHLLRVLPLTESKQTITRSFQDSVLIPRLLQVSKGHVKVGKLSHPGSFHRFISPDLPLRSSNTDVKKLFVTWWIKLEASRESRPYSHQSGGIIHIMFPRMQLSLCFCLHWFYSPLQRLKPNFIINPPTNPEEESRTITQPPQKWARNAD